MHIILIGNYKPDRQESMIRFTQMLHSGFQHSGFNVEIWWPKIYLGKGKTTNVGLGKWFGYIDKWLIFPLILQRRLKSRKIKNIDTHFHICDHSNAPYLKSLPVTTSITCHDVLAIRGSMGYKETYVSASRFGKILQKWILNNLKNATSIACVSQFTLNQLQDLVQGCRIDQKNWRVINNAFNADFRHYEMDQCKILLAKIGLDSTTPFILHVGSSHARKNRKLLIDMIVALKDEWKGKICFAGEALEVELQTYIQNLQLSDRIVSVVSPNHDVLTALYSSCAAFIFPSFSEGFGWPLIEAQACGAPVIASSIQPMPEIGSSGALYEDPFKAHAFANAFLSLSDLNLRHNLIHKGFENCKRFDLKVIIQAYINFFKLS